eukprot:TRINITY_DN54353_c0_g1_i1.p1 TRINITY_DN54353_c0_g1~~TRINITY_DN54353_c0_g1_i1.p1  ORF type:complete len:109 (+),score=19.15 TRINITY_DN54353_c0_g1_i1:1-327(+)
MASGYSPPFWIRLGQVDTYRVLCKSVKEIQNCQTGRSINSEYGILLKRKGSSNDNKKQSIQYFSTTNADYGRLLRKGKQLARKAVYKRSMPVFLRYYTTNSEYGRWLK